MLTREIKIEPAYDKRHKDPKKNYGIHAVKLYELLLEEGSDGVFAYLEGEYKAVFGETNEGVTTT